MSFKRRGLTPYQITTRALERSILHWVRMRDNVHTYPESPESKHCMLCEEFFDTVDLPNQFAACGACPVRMHTDRPRCYNTPYVVASEAWKIGNYMWSKEFSVVADLEVKFLQELMLALQNGTIVPVKPVTISVPPSSS